MAQPILALQELSKYYINGQNVVTGLNKVSLRFELGEFVAITGESGSGKSSLAHILGGILPYEDGELYLNGKPTSHYDSADWEQYRAFSVGFISQSYGILPGATVAENVISTLRLTGMDKDLAQTEARRILEEVELWPLRNRRAAKLSSGQKQRLSIARALAKPCSVLIADEPTGNLDPENSDKVIRLLAKAAETRLVILITHEFSEAEGYVTRHISLQDGRVCADARLRPHTSPAHPAPERESPRDLSRYIAGLQLKSRPAWSAIVLAFLTLTAFAVFAFLGSFLVALDDTSTRIYESDAFLNGEKERIVAVRLDGQAMTEADHDTILSLKHVESLEKYGYIRDICYAYREDVDYVIHYTQHNYGEMRRPSYIELPTPEFLSTDQFMQTVPLFPDDGEFLSEGRLPQHFGEVVASDSALLGQTITVYLRDINRWELGGCLKLDMEVVGITDQGQGLYFHDDVARTLTIDYLGADYFCIPTQTQIPEDASYVNYRDARSKAMYGPMCAPFYAELISTPGSTLRDMRDGEAMISLREYITRLTENPSANYDSLYSQGTTALSGFYNTVGIHDSTVTNVLAVTPQRFQQYLTESGVGFGDQVSITITDYAYTERVIEKLEEMGYFSLSPYVLGSAKVDPELAQQRIQTLAISLGVLAMVVILQLIVLRAMFAMQTESFRILSDMGLTFRTARRAAALQVLAFTAAAQLLAFGAIGLCAQMGVSQIGDLTLYLYGIRWVGISLVHLGSTLLAAVLICGALKKKVYPRTAGSRDLEIEEDEVAV